MYIKTRCLIIGMIFVGCAVFEQAYALQTKHIMIEATLDPASIAGTYTQAGSWTIQHNNGTSYTCTTGTSNQYSISGSPIFVSPDEDSDSVRFHNATITALNDVCGHISFWANFSPDPSGVVDLDLSSNGQIKDTVAPLNTTGSWVHISGWLQHYSDNTLPGLADGTSGSWEHIGTTNGPPGSPSPHDKHGSASSAPVNFVLATDENPDRPGIFYDRILKGELWFFLKKNHQLILNTNTGVAVITTAGGGEPPGDLDLCDFFNCELLDVLRDPSTPGRLERIEKHLNLPPFLPRPESVPSPLEEKHLSPEP